MVKSAPSIIEFVTDPQLLNMRLSPAQESCLRAAYGLPLHGALLDVYQQCTGRVDPPTTAPSEVTVIAGARAGKDSRILAPIVCYEAVFGGHDKHLHRGERCTIPLVSQDQRATGISRGYIFEYFRSSPLLRTLIEDERVNELDLTNRTTIACFPCTKSSLRGWSNPCAGLNEIAFWRLEGFADSDAEVQASIRRGMLSFPRTKLVKISTPYTRGGVLFADFQRGFGQDDPDLLVWKASSALMNPQITDARLERERRLDPLRFAREYEAEFLDDLATCFEIGALRPCVDVGVRERPPVPGLPYVAFCDAASGEKKGNDSFTVAISHREQDRVVLDLVRAWAPPFSPGAVIEEIAALLTGYGLTQIGGDRYSPGFVAEQFRTHQIRYAPSLLDRSALYLELLPLVNTGQVRLLDVPDLVRELRGLERRRGTSGRDRVDHAPGGHDDIANSCAGSLVRAARAGHRLSPALTMACFKAGESYRDPHQPTLGERGREDEDDDTPRRLNYFVH
jgi:AcrR family transcriptional regulator